MRTEWLGVQALLLLSGCVPELTSRFAPVACDPSANQWPKVDEVPELYGEGFARGEVVPDFCLPDQHDADVQLWQFTGDVVVVDVSTVWCAPCQALAQHAQETADHYADQGVVFVTLLAENLDGVDPSQEDLNAWADQFGIEEPIVADPGRGYSRPLVPDNNFPVVLVIDREMRVSRRVVPASEDGIHEAVDELLSAR